MQEAAPQTPGEPAPLRVLLISPVPGLDPPSGDVTYTRQLLAAPPPGVQYTTYEDALADGTLMELGTRCAVDAHRGRSWAMQLMIAAARKGEHLLRRTGLAYREQIRVFRVRPDRYDLIHVHVFHHRFIGTHPPVVASAGGPLRWVYGDAWGWAGHRLALADAIDRSLGWGWDATMCAQRLGRADTFIAPSEYLREWLVKRHWPKNRIAVQPNYLSRSASSMKKRSSEAPVRLGFIARDFAAKGGWAVLTAFADLRRRRPGLELLIVGSPPQLSVAEQHQAGVIWLGEVNRERLLADVLPSIDLFLYPSQFDTGVPYSAMEALSLGIPAVVSDYRALPDLVGTGAGRVSRVGDTQSIVSAAEELLEPNSWLLASSAALSRFNNNFSAESQSLRLGDIYRATCARSELERGEPR